ncbi:hypothetical protein HIM_05462 [Hirsutella minnesotensis 3608]|uniref:Thiamine-triphosphatase n=1 Tax=Hirsutella minnesotensis 3608 TaxID=1043627 RepID=A0A0F7ZUQ4_9HYPO|nr:hypothetical protein HIM_05462 [Hirsutella minnesotensis 3608]
MKTPTLEVERKFAPTPTSLRLLADNAGSPPFRCHQFQGDSSFEDVYFDTNTHALSTRGIWLRRRGVDWEAKVRVSGDYTKSAFKELTGVDAISALLRATFPGTELATDGPTGGGLQWHESARLGTLRTTYRVDHRFSVVVDKTDFGHCVGEVELEEPAGEMLENTELVRQMEKGIDEFMARYAWAFPRGNVVGKLSAYFSRLKGG